MSVTYKGSGVDINKGNKIVEYIKSKENYYGGYKNVINSIGGFNNLFTVGKKYKNPILAVSADGVGTKIKIAMTMKDYSTIGVDLVAMCVNDIICSGAKPIMFLDYIATEKLEEENYKEIIDSIFYGCCLADCPLVGGETAEMPGFYDCGKFDLAGFCVGIAEKENIIDGSEIFPGDYMIGLYSSGVHSNGFSLIRKIFSYNDYYGIVGNRIFDGINLGETLLLPTKIYVKTILNLISKYNIKGIAHITGGGLLENIPRILPEGTAVTIDKNSWEVPYIFSYIQEKGKIDQMEMFRVFNMGIGMVIVVSEQDVLRVMSELKNDIYLNCDTGINHASIIGQVISGNKKVYIG
jgi:phosphoribosylformylglycinamidine cyclo-ligase